MAGTPTLPDVQAQWDEIVKILESSRRYGDDTYIKILETLEQSALGNYTPLGFANLASGLRAGFSSLVNGSRSALAHQSMLYEFGTVINSPYRDILFVFRDVYDYVHENALHVPSRELTFGAPTPKGTPAGDGFVSRLTRDWNDYDIEACRAEVKTVICRVDQSSGTRKHAESFEVHGGQLSLDALELHDYGTGVRGTTISRHAGNGVGGSLLKNSSFSQFDGSEFSGWQGTGTFTQDQVNYYRSYPGASIDASALMDPGAVLSQKIEDSANALDVNTPYFLRVMVNPDVYGATGSFDLRIGAITFNVADVDLLPKVGGWAEIAIPFDKSCWYRNFNEQDLAIYLSFGGAGQLLVDDVLFTPWEIMDGTYMVVRGGPTPWLLDDEFSITDTQADITKGLRNYWAYIGGYGYLPNTSRGAAVGWNDPTIP